MPRHRYRPVSEINVVPYIDVMLVLLVIFMITAPLLSQGVDVELPAADAKPVDTRNQEPLIVSVDKAGSYYLNIAGDAETPIDHQTLVARVAAFVRLHPEAPVLVRGDKDANHGDVVVAMVLLQKAGVAKVGFMTKPLER